MTRRDILFFSVGFPLGAQVNRAGQVGAQSSALRWTPAPAFNGAPVLFVSKTYAGPATWLGKKIEFRRDSNGDGFSALAGVNLNCVPGRYPLALGNETAKVTVTSHAYPFGRVTVPRKFLEPPKSERPRIAEEEFIKKRIFGASPDERLWQGAFVAPVNGRYTSSFGTRRIYNGRTRSVHQGLDYNAEMGATVSAANAGRVVIAQPMYFEGGLIVIDHGESFFTMYLHLSEFLVNDGATVEKGQPIGKSGASGRVTGPHLHFAVRWQGVYLEPATLLGLWKI